MFDVLIYLFETYIHSAIEVFIDHDRLANDLFDIGFQKKDIYNALIWLKKLADYQIKSVFSVSVLSNPLPIRIYTEEELQRLNVDCQGFLLFLEHLQVLNIETREIVIERIMALEIQKINIEELKWVVLMVLFNIPSCEDAYNKLEHLLFNVSNSSILH
ncbi:DUF494 family protein [Buchnera aphidicola (Formosaphis micheliae)]|uniref:DUF494 family protein n=1 Tax=Buchnera aphidicola TaxID=9 RepID=UPI0031B8A179